VPPTTANTAPSPPASRTRTLSSAAGSVEARCTGSEALLTSWTPEDPYTVEKVNAGPSVAPSIVFARAGSRVRMTVTCVAGEPTAVVVAL
jgi:serine/threonine-protein kinase